MSQLFVSIVTLVLASSAMAFDIGVNVHSAGGGVTTAQNLADIMKYRNIKTARMDLFYDANLASFRDQVTRIRANGGSVEVSLQVQFQWDNSCNQNYAAVEQLAYDQTYNSVNQVKDIVRDIELLNETQLRPEIMNQVPWNSVGTNAGAYAGKSCVTTLASALRGMSRAVRDIRNSSGIPLRSILGVVGRDFGFLTYMQQQGVLFDVVGYHIYPTYGNASLLSDTWYGTGGPLYQLSLFGKPVHINEFHCGEIYQSGFSDVAGTTTQETCLKAIDKHMTDLKNQKLINLEAVHFYEMYNEPSKAAPENHFGLMYDAVNPKVNLFLAAAFAGGNLTSSEQQQITGRGLLTDTEIANYKSTGGSTSPSPSPTPTMSSLPDVVVTSISMNPANPVAGQAVTFSAVVKNQGTASTPAGVVLGVGFFVNGTNVNWSDNFTSSLAPGASVTLTATGGPAGISTYTGSAGTIQVQAIADDINRFAELNDSNNSLTQSFTIGSSAPAPSYLLTILSPSANATVSGIIQVKGTGPGFQNVEIHSSSNVLLARVTPDAAGNFTASVDTSQLANGAQSLRIDGWDTPAGVMYNHTDQKLLALNIQNGVVVQPPSADTQAPSVSITSPGNGASFNRKSIVSVSANASDDVGVVDVQFYLNGALICTDSTAAYSCSMRMPNQRRTNTIEVRARDAAGNVGRQSIQVYSR
jgi:hypothetical protein